ncbi:hypothetical protein [Pseudomonas canadensis]|uniref:hypothetical protein n=1 Tax=Pseudomonas canadensis TaxID=915099 RepID=UPI003B9FB0C7
MFKEIAIDPAAVSTSYRDFSYIIEKFGIHEGRLIAAFPSKWKALVYAAAQQRLRGTLELSRLEIRLNSLGESVFYARGRSGEGCKTNWLAAAIAEHQRLPFDAIIASEPAGPPVVVAEELDGQHVCLLPNRQWSIQREAGVMGLLCAPLLASAKHIKLIDPYFDPGQPRFQRPFREFLKYVRAGAKIDIFRGDDQGEQYISQRIEQAAQGLLADGVKVRLFLRPQGEMHNRFVLTELGGVYFQTGLDDRDGGIRRTDDAGLLDPDIWAERWGQYTAE